MPRLAGGGGGRSFSGGGRSMGGGSRSSSRSFGGSMRSHLSSGSFGSYRRAGSGSSSSSYSGHRPSGSYRRDYGYGYGSGPGYYRRGGVSYGGAPIGGGGTGCFTTIIIIVIMMIIFSSLSKKNPDDYNYNGHNTSSQSLYLNKPKYEGKVDTSHGYYTDMSEGSEKFIDHSNEGRLIDGFKSFYDKTGVYPHLYIIEKAEPDMDAYVHELYEKLFKEEGNLLIVYVADVDDCWFSGGRNIGDTIDDKALDVIIGKIYSLWDNGNLAVRFGDGLDRAGKDITSKSPWYGVMTVLIVALAVIILVFILFKWWQKKKQAEREEAEHLEQILSQPLETFGTEGMNDLKDKYDNAGNNSNNTTIH